MKDQIRVLMLVPLNEIDHVEFVGGLPFADITFSRRREFTPEQAAIAQVVIGAPPVERLDEFTSMRVLQLTSAGTEPYSDPGVLPSSVVLTNGAGFYNEPISEYILGAMFYHMQHYPLMIENQKEHVWEPIGIPKTINGSTILVAGAGNIGGRFAQKARMLGAKTIIGIRRNTAQLPDGFDEVCALDKMASQLPRADVVVSVLPDTAQTRGLYDKKMFAQFKEGAIFINVGRGSAVDLAALADALNSGRLGGATIDVTDPEPLPPDHPVWDTPNLMITPHNAGGWRPSFNPTSENSIPMREMLVLFADNLKRYHEGRTLRNVVEHNQ